MATARMIGAVLIGLGCIAAPQQDAGAAQPGAPPGIEPLSRQTRLAPPSAGLREALVVRADARSGEAVPEAERRWLGGVCNCVALMLDVPAPSRPYEAPLLMLMLMALAATGLRRDARGVVRAAIRPARSPRRWPSAAAPRAR